MNPAPQTETATDSALQTSDGKTTIADQVVAKIAGIAAREISGVYNLGGVAARAVGMLRERIPGAKEDHTQGVDVTVDETTASVEIGVIAEYGVALADLAASIRRNVIGAIERMTGLDVTEVNITVHDVHLDSDDDSNDTQAS